MLLGNHFSSSRNGAVNHIQTRERGIWPANHKIRKSFVFLLLRTKYVMRVIDFIMVIGPIFSLYKFLVSLSLS